ncbi:GNAT family N-acetyltransferase [Chlorogloeopsis sp. ULAP02]|uniref:GNAT family N-acetyltransferase n=1 Tax=Chlorogloeopsis sp. ULAP02 TaxID=3107926 RepID=UPI003136C145
MIVQHYNPQDLEDTVQLWYRTWHHTFPLLQHPQPYSAWKIRFRDELAARGSVWVAEVKNRIVGFVVVMKEEHYLAQLFVAPSYQNRGVGSALVKKAKEICPLGLTLQTLQENTRACVFYERHDFQVGNLSINKINGQPNVEYYWLP